MSANLSNGRRRILVVDDEADVLLVYRLTLERGGHEVTTVERGADAIEACMTHDFDIAFLDIAMPEMDGVQTLKRIQEVSPDTKVIMITAFLEPTFSPGEREARVAAAVRLGAVACLRKPFTVDKILDAVRYFGGPKEALGRRRAIVA